MVNKYNFYLYDLANGSVSDELSHELKEIQFDKQISIGDRVCFDHGDGGQVYEVVGVWHRITDGFTNIFGNEE